MIAIAERTQLAVSAIRIDGGTQIRAESHHDVVQDYAQAMLEDATFPPVIIFYDGSHYWLADGFHRYHAAQQICRETIDADVRQGTRRDAVLYSVGANASHGLRRTNADKRRAVETLLRDGEWAKWNDREIARRCVVGHSFVSNMRHELSVHDGQIENRLVERNGAIYTQNTTNIGIRKEPTEEKAAFFEQWSRDNLALGLDRFGDPLPDKEEEEAPEALETHVQERRGGVPAALQMSESNEWYTPAKYVEAARELMGGIDIDPASNAFANEQVIHASTYYDIHTNGLDKDWHGRVWLNPPYGRDSGESNQEIWTHRLIEQYALGITTEAVLLVNANTEAKWFQSLYDYPICFTNHRIKFYTTDGTPNQPTQGNALVYLGHQQERFVALFKQFGVVVRRIDD